MSESDPTIAADPARAQPNEPGRAARCEPPAGGRGPDARQRAEAAYRQAIRVDRRFAPHAALALQRVDELGRGGMGVVTRVVDRRLEREAALKALAPQRALDPHARALFEREVAVTALLNHPAIPPVYEAGADARGAPYMLMRLVEGETYAERIAAHHARGEPSRAELLEALLKVSDAVAYAHSQGVIHRDLKPANVMVGRFGDVLLMDWGLALCVKVDDLQGGAAAGTPGYMSPEQAGAGPVDERADVFALGAMLVAALTGAPPFEGDAVARTTATLVGDVVLPRDRRPDAPRELHSLAARALARLPQRLASASAFSAELRAFLADEPLTVHRYGLSERLTRVVRRRPTLIAAGLAGSVLCALLGLLGMQLARAGEAEARAEAERAVEQQRRQEAEARRREAERGRRLAEARREEAEAVRSRTQRALDLLQEARALARRFASAEEVRARVEQAVTTEASPALRFSAAEVCHEAGLVEDARALLEGLIAAAPADAPPYEALWFLHRIELEASRRVLHDSEPLARLERLARERGEENEFTALLAADRATLAGDDAQALRHLEAALARNPDFADALAARAGLHYRRYRYAQALVDANRALAIEPALTVALGTRALTHLREGRAGLALIDLDAVLLRLPGEPLFLHARAEARLGAQDPAGALRDAEAALEQLGRRGAGLAPAVAQATERDLRALAAAAEAALGRHEAALARFTGLEGLERDMDCITVLSQLLETTGRWEALRELGERVARALPTSAVGPILVGVAHARVGRLAEARAALDRAVELDPEYEYARGERGGVLAALGELERAERDLAFALQRAPRRAHSWISLSQLHLRAGRPEEAHQAAERALALDAQLAPALLARAAARRALGRAGALQDVTLALARGGAPPEAHRLRAELRAAAGDRWGARRDLRRYLELAPAAPDAAEARARLEALE